MHKNVRKRNFVLGFYSENEDKKKRRAIFKTLNSHEHGSKRQISATNWKLQLVKIPKSYMKK